MTVIAGAPPAEFGDKTSLVIDVTTRSGLGSTTPHGDVTACYGTFGTLEPGCRLLLWRQELGKLHRRQRAEHRPLPRSAGVRGLPRPRQRRERVRPLRLSCFHRRTRCTSTSSLPAPGSRTPNSYDQQFHDINGVVLTEPFDGSPVGPDRSALQDPDLQHRATWTHTISPNAVLNVTGYVRRDAYNYYPSNDPFADLGPRISAGNRRPAAHAAQCRRAREHHLYQRHSQHEGRGYV